MSSNLTRKTARRKKQTRLMFDPIDPDLRSSSPANVRYHLPNQRNTPSSTKKSYQAEVNEDSEDPLCATKKSVTMRSTKGKGKAKDGKLPFKALPTPVKSSQTTSAGATFSKNISILELSEDEIEGNMIRAEHRSRNNSTNRVHTSSRKSRSRPVIDLDESDGSPPEDEVETPSKRRKEKRQVTSRNHIDGLDQEDDDVEDIPALPKRSTRSARSHTTPTASKVRSRTQSSVTLSSDTDNDSASISIEDGSEDEDAVKSSINMRQRRHIVQDDQESDEDLISSPTRQKRIRTISSDSEDSDIRSSPQKRRKRIIDHGDEDDQSDLPPVEEIRPNRITRQLKTRKHRTEREKKMELLRRKRAGELIEELTDSTETSEPKKGIYDSNSDSDLEMLKDFEDDSEPEVIQKPNKNVNNYDSDFVVEDDEDGLLGVPVGLLDIPLQFRHAAHKPMKEHFKDAIEWMVHRKINPAFSRNDEVYLQAFIKLDDEYMGYAKSKFVSTQWTAEFTRAIYARPILIERPCGPGEGYTIDGLPKCDVCNHRKHFPKFALHFEGKAYHKSTLEEVERQEDIESESESDDAVSLNSKGHSLPAEDKEWFSGIVCRDNAQQAHALIHWKYALNEWVLDQLESEGYLTPEKLAEREKMKAKKRREYANALVDQWEETGIIKNLYRDFKGQLEAARESKQGRWERGKFSGFSGFDD